MAQDRLWSVPSLARMRRVLQRGVGWLPGGAGALTLAVGIALSLAPEQLEAQDSGSLSSRALETIRGDLSRWTQYSFERAVDRRRVDAEGRTNWRTEYIFRVTPNEGAFEEQLLLLDGVEPTKRQIDDHRKAGRFASHYSDVVLEGSQYAEDDGVSIAFLLHLDNFAPPVEVTKDGVDAYRLDFSARLERRDGGSLQRLADSTRGSLWVSRSGLHLVRAEAELIRPFRRGPVTLHHFAIEVGTMPVDDFRLPSRLRVASELTVLGVRRRIRNLYTYADFERAVVTP